MGNEEIKVFISYAREDYDTAKRLYDDLKAAGISPWMDKENLFTGENWKVIINKAIQDSCFFLALLSSHSLTKRGYVQKELKAALDILNEFSDEDIFILPVRIDECKPQDEKLKYIQWADIFSSYENAINDILRSIYKKSPEFNYSGNQKAEEQKKIKSAFYPFVYILTLISLSGILFLVYNHNSKDKEIERLEKELEETKKKIVELKVEIKDLIQNTGEQKSNSKSGGNINNSNLSEIEIILTEPNEKLSENFNGEIRISGKIKINDSINVNEYIKNKNMVLIPVIGNGEYITSDIIPVESNGSFEHTWNIHSLRGRTLWVGLFYDNGNVKSRNIYYNPLDKYSKYSSKHIHLDAF